MTANPLNHAKASETNVLPLVQRPKGTRAETPLAGTIPKSCPFYLPVKDEAT